MNNEINKKEINKKEKGQNKFNEFFLKSFFRILLILIFIISLINFVEAKITLERVQFDPAVISAGDEVDIIIQYKVDTITKGNGRINNFDYQFKVELLPDDSLTKKYIRIDDAEGNNLNGALLPGYYNKKFRVKVSTNAPPGKYEFLLKGYWIKDNEVLDGSESKRFIMEVKKEGIIINVANINTEPAEIRPGDDFVNLNTFFENSGEKDAKSLEVFLDLPKGIKSSYSDNNRKWIGKLNGGETKKVVFNIDIDELVKSGVYNITFNMKYMDLENNKYTKKVVLPIYIKKRPYLEIIQTKGEGYRGARNKFYVYVQNKGEETAEAVDVRIIKQSSQPFDMDVRSKYIGELEPGEVGLAIFDIDVKKEAEFKKHDFRVLIRAKGDSDEGDENIYLFNRRAKFEVVGEKESPLFFIGLISFSVLFLFLLISLFIKRGGKK